MADQPPDQPRAGPEPGESASGDDDHEGRENPFGVFPLVVLVVLVVGGLFLVFKMREMGSIQDCVSSGRRNCAPLDVPASK